MSAMILGFAAHKDLQAAEAKAHNAAMRTITIMLPVRYNESPAPVHEQMIPASADGGPSHGPLSGQLLGALPQQPPFVVSRWSARFDLPSPENDNGSLTYEGDRDRSAKDSSSPPLSPDFIFHLLTGGRFQPPRHEAHPAHLPGWNRSPANEIQRQQMTSQERPEVEWRPEQLLHRYMDVHRQQQPFAAHRDGPRGDTMLKNNVVMTAVAYGLLGGDHSQRPEDKTSPSTTSTTTAATTNTNRKRKLSAERRHRASGRYRPYPYPGRRRAIRRQSHFDLTFDSDDEDDGVLEALFGYDRSPMTFRRVRRPSSSQVGARRTYGRKRLGDGGADRRRRWRQRGDAAGKLRRRNGGRATPSSDRQQQTGRGRRPGDTGTARDKPTQQPTTPSDVLPNAESRRRVSLLHIVVSRQQDFPAPQPAPGFVDHPGLLPEPRPLDADPIHPLSQQPFIQPSPPFFPLRPIIGDAHVQQRRHRYVACSLLPCYTLK